MNYYCNNTRRNNDQNNGWFYGVRVKLNACYQITTLLSTHWTGLYLPMTPKPLFPSKKEDVRSKILQTSKKSRELPTVETIINYKLRDPTLNLLWVCWRQNYSRPYLKRKTLHRIDSIKLSSNHASTNAADVQLFDDFITKISTVI